MAKISILLLEVILRQYELKRAIKTAMFLINHVL